MLRKLNLSRGHGTDVLPRNFLELSDLNQLSPPHSSDLVRARRVRALALMTRPHRSSFDRLFLLGVAVALASCLAGASGANGLTSTAASPPSSASSQPELAFCPALACLAADADATRDRDHGHIDGNVDSSNMIDDKTTAPPINASATRRMFDCIGRRLFGPFAEDAMRTQRRETHVVHTCGGTSSARIDAGSCFGHRAYPHYSIDADNALSFDFHIALMFSFISFS